MSKCYGCGAILQTTKQDSVGFTKDLENELCERCFRVIHYHELKVVKLNNDVESIIDKINKSNHFCFYFCDLLNINEESLAWFKKITTKKCLIISKSDMIPNFIFPENISYWLKETLQIKNDILYLSAKRNEDINYIFDYIEKRQIETCFFAGMTNVGKSTFLNEMLHLQGKNNIITASEMPNTTLDMLEIEFENLKILDTPGFGYQTFPYQNLSLIKKLNIKKMLKPKVYQMKKEESLLIDDFLRVETKDNTNITVYLSNNFLYQKIYPKNNKLREQKVMELHIPKAHDLVIKGVGFLYFTKSCRLVINSKEAFDYEIRPSFLGRKNQI